MPASACWSAITSGVAITSLHFHSNHAALHRDREGLDGDVRGQVHRRAGLQVESRAVARALDGAILRVQLSLHQLPVVVRAAVLDGVQRAIAVEDADLEVVHLDEALLAGRQLVHGADVVQGAHQEKSDLAGRHSIERHVSSPSRPANVSTVASGPLIGVTTSEVRRAERTQPLPEGEPPQHEMALGMPYVRALARAGAVPVVLPPLGDDAIPALLALLQAGCLSGGPDLDPAAYGARPAPELGPVEPALDRFELEVARVADAMGLPILGICRGAEAINVARGGTLHQHLPTVTDHSIGHRQTAPGWQETHAVRIDPESRLHRVLGTDAPRVNSFHHQAVDRLGAGLRAVAWAPDGTVEASGDATDRLALAA